MVSGSLHDVRREFTDDVSETALGPILTGHKWEYVLSLMTKKDTVHKPQNQQAIW